MRYHVSIIHETGHLREYDVFPGSLLSLPAEIAMPWTDTTTPRTDAPVRFVAHAARPDYRTFRGVSGLSSHVVRLPA